MRAVRLYEAGEPENLILEDLPVPNPFKNWVLVRIRAFGLNRSELMTRKGLSPNVSFPRIPGIECVGEIVSDPSGDYITGQKIAALMGGMGRDYDGSYAEYILLPKDNLVPFESTLEWEVLGAIPEMFHTVNGSLHLSLKIERGEKILIRGGTSTIGLLALHFAKLSGMIVIATTRKKEKTELLTRNGADYVLIDDGKIIDKVCQLFPEGVDKVLELVGASTLKDSLQCTARGGTLCMTGMLSETWVIPCFEPMEYIPSSVHFTVFDSGQHKMDKTAFQKFILDVESGNIHINIGHIFSLGEIVEAHRLMENNMADGKIVIKN
jgi:NADPH:quinone reductase